MTAADWLARVLPQLKVDRGPDKRGEYVAWCPFHPDGQGTPPHQPNLSVSVRGYYCHACHAKGGLKTLAQALGINSTYGNGHDRPRSISHSYAYRDKTGKLLFEVVRTDPKGFYQRRPDGKNGWITNLNGTRRVLYRLPELISHSGDVVWIVEGEKDADRLAGCGLQSTTNPGGAGKWRPGYTQCLHGREIVILPDNDDVGRQHAHTVTRSLSGTAKSIKIVHLPETPPKGDVSDWLDAGHTVEELAQLAQATPVWNATTAEQINVLEASEQPQSVQEAVDDPHRLARIFLERCGNDDQGRVALRFWRDQWWRWTGTHYRLLEKNDLRAEITAAAKITIDEWTAAHDAGTAAKKVTHHLVTNILQALGGLVLVPANTEQPAWLGVPEQNRRYLSLGNGLLDLEGFLSGNSGELIPHSPEWFSPFHLPYAFDPAADCPRWLDFLAEVFEGDRERINLLQEWFGYCLMPDTSQQKFLVLEGEGANGKSVVCDLLTALLGEQNVAHVPLELFGQRFQLTMTLGKLANIAAEVGDLDKAAEGVLKAFTAGDRMNFDRKGIPGIEAYPTARLVLATNNRPRFSDRSSGLWRRMLLMPFRVTIPEERQDHHLPTKLRHELPGIFCWAIAGCHRLHRNGKFTNAKVCAEAREEYRIENNPARLFLTEQCREEPGVSTPCALLYRSYKDWCEANGYHGLGERMLGKEIVRIYPRIKRVKRGTREEREYQYEGLAVSRVSPVSHHPSPGYNREESTRI